MVVPVRAARPSSSNSTPPTSREWLPWCCAIGQQPALGNLRALSSCRVANRVTSTVIKEYSDPSLCGTGWPGEAGSKRTFGGRWPTGGDFCLVHSHMPTSKTIRLAWRPGLRATTGSTKQDELSGLASSLTSPSSCFSALADKTKRRKRGLPHALSGLSVLSSVLQFSLHETFPGDWTR